MRTLLAIPVFNEQKHVAQVLEHALEVLESDNALQAAGGTLETSVLVIDDGSTDATPQLLAQFPVEVVRHSTNRGYGRSMQDAFRWAAVDRFDWVITMDCDEQHEPDALPEFLEAQAAADAARDDTPQSNPAQSNSDAADVISGSRYFIPPEATQAEGAPPPDRRRINGLITTELNERLGLSLTDGFCGYKSYRVAALEKLRLTQDGYAFPMQFWVQAVAHGLTTREIPVKLIYNDLKRSFGGPLDIAETRLAHYRRVLHCELDRCGPSLPTAALAGVTADCPGA
ncbi:MAG: glycosyltransferase family 2 protein [Planctomycetota bacterium]